MLEESQLEVVDKPELNLGFLLHQLYLLKEVREVKVLVQTLQMVWVPPETPLQV